MSASYGDGSSFVKAASSLVVAAVQSLGLSTARVALSLTPCFLRVLRVKRQVPGSR